MAITMDSNNYISAMQNSYVQNLTDKTTNKISSASDSTNAATTNQTLNNSLLSNVNDARQKISSINNIAGIMQVADKTLSKLSTNANQIMQLATNFAENKSNTNNNAQKEFLSTVQDYKASMQQSLSNALFNGQNVFGNALSFDSSNNTFSINLTTPNISSIDALNPNTIQNFMSSLTTQRTNINSMQQNLLSSVDNLVNNTSLNNINSQQVQNNNIANNAVASNNQNNLQLNSTALTNAHNVSLLQNRLASLLA